MTKAFFILVGLVLIGLGIWGAVAWSDAVLMFLEAIAVIVALFAGLVIIVFTLSDLRAAELPVEAPPAPAASANSSDAT